MSLSSSNPTGETDSRDTAACEDAPRGARAVGMRTDWCGELRVEDVGREVSICGWLDRRREHGEHLAFADVRDRTGIIQCVVDGSVELRTEWVVRVTGTVQLRPEGTRNPGIGTGDVEIRDVSVDVLSRSEPPPIPLDGRVEVEETTRLRHRPIDLRSARLQRNLATRARVNAAIRQAMQDQGFTEIETPLLIASTPEGARDFVVPSRLHPGRFYALPQSPQLFKQLCMVGGIDRYYQMARCLRDEDLRADRQFEFTQLDMEASFVGSDEIIDFVTDAVMAAVSAASASASEPTGDDDSARSSEFSFETMSWAEAMDRFGSDKPDLRFGMELVELTEVFSATEFRAFEAECVKGIRVAGGATASRKELDALTERAKRAGAQGLVWMRVEPDRTLNSPVTKFMSDAEIKGVVDGLAAEPGDLLLLVADRRRTAQQVLGNLRLSLGRPAMGEGGLRFVWVVDFPLFEGVDETGRPRPAHHPFTMPHEDDLEALLGGGSLDSSSLLEVRSQAYDLVLNGWELGSGSVRIHQRELQERILELLGIDQESAQERFGFLLDAFRFGAPPHAGFAFGTDRLVAILLGEENIREVIAFPKTQSGSDPLTRAPTSLDGSHLDELGLRLAPGL